MKKLIIRLFVAFVVIPASVFGVLFHLNKNGFFNLQNSQLKMDVIPSGQEAYFLPLQAQLENSLQVFKGRSLWKLSLRDVKKFIQKNDWVESVQIKKSWPHSLEIYVKPVDVQFVAKSEAGQVVPVSSRGKVLKPVSVTQAPDAILIKEDLLKKTDDRLKMLKMIQEVPEKGAFSRQAISEARLEKDGFWVTLMRSGIDVKLGNEQIALKSARVSKVVEYLDSRQMDARVIDADLSKKVLVRLQQAP